jgi:two-component system, chemotaxis family, response regulator Rcp1
VSLPTGEKALVLLAEDSDADVELTQLSIQQTGRAVELQVVRDGEECMAFLRRAGPYAAAARPQLVLLDLHMPRMNGLEVLEAIKADANLKSVPVVVLTTSDSRSDVEAAYARYCSGYIVKPMKFSQFSAAIEAVLTYWLSHVALPVEPRT